MKSTCAGILILVVSAGCATVIELTALRRVDFRLDRVDQVRIAGIAIDRPRSFSRLTASEASRLLQAVAAEHVPLELVVHVRGANPRENRVTARLVAMDWTLFLENRETVSGRMENTHVFPPGDTVDVPVPMSLDLLDFFRKDARNAFELALSLAGYGGASKEVRLEALPRIETPLGPLRYPARITIRRRVG